MSVTTDDPLNELLQTVRDLARGGPRDAFDAIADELHPSDLAEVLIALGSDEERLAVITQIPAELASETLAEMDEGDLRARLFASLGPAAGADLLHELADDDAADLVGELDPGDRARVLAALPAEEAGDLRELLSYDEETAGGLMTTELVSVRNTITAGEAISAVRVQGREVEDFYTVFVLDEQARLLGTVPLNALILSEPGAPVDTLLEPVQASVLPDVDQEDVGRLMARYNLVSIPVLDPDGVLLGRITFDDVIDVIEAEQTEDILRMAGVSDEEELTAGWGEAVRARLPWLFLNLLTASLAAGVVVFFQSTIADLVILAAIMPIIAGMGGNAGTQALAVTIRRIAVSGASIPKRFGAVRKEVVVGLVNGLTLGLVVALVVGLAEGDSRLGWVILFAMWGNILVAGFAGASIPTVLNRFGIDPAVASSVFVTAFTDLLGFFLLLGLATWFLL